MPGRILGHERGEGGEGRWESGCTRVGVWGRTGDPKGGQAPSEPAIGDDRGDASLPGQDGGRGGEEVVRRPSLHPVPETIHASESSEFRGEEVGSVCEYRAKEAGGAAVAQEGTQACPWGGQALDKRGDSLG